MSEDGSRRWKNELQGLLEDKFDQLDKISNKFVQEVCKSVFDQVYKYKMLHIPFIIIREMCQDIQDPDFSKNDSVKCQKKIKKKFRVSMRRLKATKSRLRRQIDLIDTDRLSNDDTEASNEVINKQLKMSQMITGMSKQPQSGSLMLSEIPCQYCGKPFSKVISYSKHLQDVHMKKIQVGFQCQTCPVNSTQSRVLARHLSTQHSQSVRVGTEFRQVYICPRTGKQFDKKDQLDLLQTYLNHTLDYVAFKPKEIEKKETKRPKEIEHVSTTDLDQRNQVIKALIPTIVCTPTGLFICPKCQMQFVTTRLLAKHLKQENNYTYPNYYFCPKCLEARHQCQPIAKHLLQEHGKGEPPIYRCRYTDKTFSDPVLLRKHLERSYYYSTFFTELTIPINYFKQLEQSDKGND